MTCGMTLPEHSLLRYPMWLWLSSLEWSSCSGRILPTKDIHLKTPLGPEESLRLHSSVIVRLDCYTIQRSSCPSPCFCSVSVWPLFYAWFTMWKGFVAATISMVSLQRSIDPQAADTVSGALYFVSYIVLSLWVGWPLNIHTTSFGDRLTDHVQALVYGCYFWNVFRKIAVARPLNYKNSALAILGIVIQSIATCNQTPLIFISAYYSRRGLLCNQRTSQVWPLP